MAVATADPGHGAVGRTDAVEDALTAAGYRVARERLYALLAADRAASDAVLHMIVVIDGVVVAIVSCVASEHVPGTSGAPSPPRASSGPAV